jgi:hypothetical protein
MIDEETEGHECSTGYKIASSVLWVRNSKAAGTDFSYHRQRDTQTTSPENGTEQSKLS